MTTPVLAGRTPHPETTRALREAGAALETAARRRAELLPVQEQVTAISPTRDRPHRGFDRESALEADFSDLGQAPIAYVITCRLPSCGSLIICTPVITRAIPVRRSPLLPALISVCDGWKKLALTRQNVAPLPCCISCDW